MQMIDVLKRLAELDANNPNVVTTAKPETKEAVITEGAEVKLPEMPEPGLSDLKALSGVKTLTESTIAECGMMPMGSPMPPTMPASLNMSAGNAGEIVAMMRGIMDLAKSDIPTQSTMPTMGASVKDLLTAEPEHDIAHSGPASGGEVPVSGPSFGDDEGEMGGVDDAGDSELADMLRKIKTGEPVKIKTDMPVKVSSDEPIRGTTTDKLNAKSDDENEAYDNSPKPEQKGDGTGNDFANIINKVRTADMADTPFGSGSNPMPEKKEESSDPLAAFESKLFADYKKFVAEGPKPEDVPAFIRKSKEPGKAAAKTANDKRNEKAGAKVWSSPRK